MINLTLLSSSSALIIDKRPAEEKGKEIWHKKKEKDKRKE
jgi:hypothetical protein